MSTKNLLTLENGTSILSWNVCSKLQLTLCSIPKYGRLCAGLFRPCANCHYFYLSLIIRTIICHIYGTDQMCLTPWCYWFLCFFLSNWYTVLVIDTQVIEEETYSSKLQTALQAIFWKIWTRRRNGGINYMFSRSVASDYYGGH